MIIHTLGTNTFGIMSPFLNKLYLVVGTRRKIGVTEAEAGRWSDCDCSPPDSACPNLWKPLAHPFILFLIYGHKELQHQESLWISTAHWIINESRTAGFGCSLTFGCLAFFWEFIALFSLRQCQLRTDKGSFYAQIMERSKSVIWPPSDHLSHCWRPNWGWRINET